MVRIIDSLSPEAKQALLNFRQTGNAEADRLRAGELAESLNLSFELLGQAFQELVDQVAETAAMITEHLGALSTPPVHRYPGVSVGFYKRGRR